MLIVIEGIDGSGKSTLAKGLADKLQQKGNSVLLTREPGGSKLGKSLRQILQTQPVPIDPVAEYLLFAADRAQHIKDVVQPALKEGKIVISDRMGDSSLAYQGYGRNIDKEQIKSVNKWAMQQIQPDIVFYLSINAQQAAERVASRAELSSFEKEEQAFVHKLIDGFEEIFKNRPEVITLDGTLSPEQVTEQALKVVESWQQPKPQ